MLMRGKAEIVSEMKEEVFLEMKPVDQLLTSPPYPFNTHITPSKLPKNFAALRTLIILRNHRARPEAAAPTPPVPATASRALADMVRCVCTHTLRSPSRCAARRISQLVGACWHLLFVLGVLPARMRARAAA